MKDFKFQDILNELSRSNDINDIDSAIDAWCRKLNYPPKQIKQCKDNWLNEISDTPIIKEVLELYKISLSCTDKIITGGVVDSRFLNIFNKITPEQLKENIIPFNKITPEKFKENIISKTKQEIEDKTTMSKTTIIILIAFVLAAIGIVIYQYQEPKRNRKERKKQKQDTYSDSRPEKYILLLVLNAERGQKLIQKLREKKEIDSDMVQELSSSSIVEFLWQGKLSEYEKYNLDSRFQEYRQTDQQSQYDVYFVKIELDQPEKEFEKGYNSMKRHKAFQRLIQKEGSYPIQRISERLPKESYNLSELYH